MATVTKVMCDIKGCNQEVKGYGQGIHIHVVFHTDQTEGRSVNPYFSNEKMDICEPCMAKIMDSYPLQAAGAQGYNDYRIIEKK